MKKFLIFLFIFLCSYAKVIAHIAPPPLEKVHKIVKSNLKKVKILMTAYFPGEGDVFSNRHIGARGDKLKHGIAAVNFAKIPYGSKLKIEGIGEFLALDTGSAVVNRKAARERGLNCMVVDLFFESRRAANIFLANNSEVAYCSWE